MSTMDITAFQNTLHVTADWLHELCDQLGRDDPQQAYRILRAVLITLRDRMPVQEASDLGAQLPMLIRGIYYEEWNPSKTPTKERNVEAFLARVAEQMVPAVDGDPEEATRAVFRLLEQRITAGQIEDVKNNFPRHVRTLWP